MGAGKAPNQFAEDELTLPGIVEAGPRRAAASFKWRIIAEADGA